MTDRSLGRWAFRAAGAAATAIVLTAAMAGAAGAQPAGRSVPATSNPYSPAFGHPYRHGVVPTLMRQRAMRSWARRHPVAAARSSNNLSFGGGVDGIGVTTGAEKIYLVFFGSQWGARGTDSGGNTTLAGDTSGEAPYLQRLFKGLGRTGDTWSGVMTQYCQGVARGVQSCPANSFHVAYPGTGTLAGVWADESTASPSQATGHQLGAEAVRAAGHFGNTTAASNRNAQYVILSPTGTFPDGFNNGGGFCAWHDWNGDTGLSGGAVSSPYGDIAFTNMPYVPDAGLSCGQDFVNFGSAGTLDGVSIVEGHEYAETITDQNPAGGWTNFGTGEENGDQCAWDPAGQAVVSQNLTLPTGTFAMQPTWGNDGSNGAGSCEFSHRAVGNNWVLNGGFETGTLSHWTSSGVTSIVSSGAEAGKFAARTGRPTASTGSSSITQTFKANGAQLSFWYNVTCPDTVTQSWVTASLHDNTANSTVTVLAKTCVAHSGWIRVSRTVTVGHSYTVTLTSHDDGDTTVNDGTFALFDEVTNR